MLIPDMVGFVKQQSAMLMKIALVHLTNAFHTAVTADQMQSALEERIRVHRGNVNVVGTLNAIYQIPVHLENAKGTKRLYKVREMHAKDLARIGTLDVRLAYH